MTSPAVISVADRARLGALGARLRQVGLTPRALEAWLGTAHLPALAARLATMATTAPPRPAAVALELFVAGRAVDVELVERVLGDALADLLADHLLVLEDGACTARLALLPLGGGLAVADRLDAAPALEQVPWPDDSSFHLVGALPPERVGAWLDVGTGSAIAPLARPGVAERIVARDLNPRAVAAALLGGALSGLAHLRAERADLLADVTERFDLITFNAPIPDAARDDATPRWRASEPGLLLRFWPAAAAALAPGGMIIVHAAATALPPRGALRGERVAVVYTPPEVPTFAVTWWRPDDAARETRIRRPLAVAAPHLRWDDRDLALAGAGDPSLDDAW
jgi:hypothetical protein